MVSLEPMTLEIATQLWEEGHRDDAWPLPHRTAHSFLSLVNDYVAAESLHYGTLRVLSRAKEPVGFVIFNVVAEHWLSGEELSTVECGTYLLPQFRGMGVNMEVKRLTLEHAFDSYSAEWCVFVVPVENTRARRAMENIPWRWHETTLDSGQRFQKYLRRKVWESGRDCVAYYIHRTDRPHNS